MVFGYPSFFQELLGVNLEPLDSCLWSYVGVRWGDDNVYYEKIGIRNRLGT